MDAWQWLESVLSPDSGLSATERLVAIVVWRRWNRSGNGEKFAASSCYEARQGLARATALSLRTIAGTLAALERKGWLCASHRKSGKDWSKRAYSPSLPASGGRATVARANAALPTDGRAVNSAGRANPASMVMQQVHTNSYSGNHQSKSQSEKVRNVRIGKPLRTIEPIDSLTPAEAERRKAEQLERIRAKGIDV